MWAPIVMKLWWYISWILEGWDKHSFTKYKCYTFLFKMKSLCKGSIDINWDEIETLITLTPPPPISMYKCALYMCKHMVSADPDRTNSPSCPLEKICVSLFICFRRISGLHCTSTIVLWQFTVCVGGLHIKFSYHKIVLLFSRVEYHAWIFNKLEHSDLHTYVYVNISSVIPKMYFQFQTNFQQNVCFCYSVPWWFVTWRCVAPQALGHSI